MATTTNVQQVKLNIMTQSQYDSATKNPSELYMITDAEVLPSQSGQSGKFLTINGTTASWAEVSSCGSEEDNLSITKNASDKIQTVGIINQANSSASIKTWSGTLS